VVEHGLKLGLGGGGGLQMHVNRAPTELSVHKLAMLAFHRRASARCQRLRELQLLLVVTTTVLLASLSFWKIN
jgi:hypothetical protein